jgi:hypothetical protein
MKIRFALLTMFFLLWTSLGLAQQATPSASPPASGAGTPEALSAVDLAPLSVLVYSVIGLVLGAAGQGVRSIVTWKQLHDEAAQTDATMDELFRARDLLISFGIGAVAGVCASLALLATKTPWDIRSALGLMLAGYAGADFIEGFAKQYLAPGKNHGNSQGKTNTTPSRSVPDDDPNAKAAMAENSAKG